MTTVTGKVEIGPGRAPSSLTRGKSYVRVRVADMVTTSAGVLMLPVVGDPTLLEADGSFSVVVDPIPQGYAHVFDFVIDDGRYVSPPLFKRVPASGTVELDDLENMAPVSGSQFGTPAWVAQVLAARDQILAAAGGAGVGPAQDEAIAAYVGDEDSATRGLLDQVFALRGHTHAWADVSGKPTSYPPATHGHVITDITGLQEKLEELLASALPNAVRGAAYSAEDGWPERPASDLPVMWTSILFPGVVRPPQMIDGDMWIESPPANPAP